MVSGWPPLAASDNGVLPLASSQSTMLSWCLALMTRPMLSCATPISVSSLSTWKTDMIYIAYRGWARLIGWYHLEVAKRSIYDPCLTLFDPSSLTLPPLKAIIHVCVRDSVRNPWYQSLFATPCGTNITISQGQAHPHYYSQSQYWITFHWQCREKGFPSICFELNLRRYMNSITLYFYSTFLLNFVYFYWHYSYI